MLKMNQKKCINSYRNNIHYTVTVGQLQVIAQVSYSFIHSGYFYSYTVHIQVQCRPNANVYRVIPYDPINYFVLVISLITSILMNRPMMYTRDRGQNQGMTGQTFSTVQQIRVFGFTICRIRVQTGYYLFTCKKISYGMCAWIIVCPYFYRQPSICIIYIDNSLQCTTVQCLEQA